jgi:hypothetical protein
MYIITGCEIQKLLRMFGCLYNFFFAQNKLAGNSLTAITAVLFGQLNLCLCVTTYKIINNSLSNYNDYSRTTKFAVQVFSAVMLNCTLYCHLFPLFSVLRDYLLIIHTRQDD